MNKRIKWMGAVLAVSASAATADVTLDFLYSGANLGGLQPVTLAFTVDGSGNVTLDASTASANTANIDAVNAWDGSVGTVSAGFGTSFILKAGTGGPGLNLRSLTSGAGAGAFGISGVNAGAIDGAGAETLSFTASTLSAGLSIDVLTVDYAGRLANGQSSLSMTDGTEVYETLISNASTYGTYDVSASGFNIGNTEAIRYSVISGNLGGYSLAGMSFDVVPEPATFGLVTVFGASILFIRRNLLML